MIRFAKWRRIGILKILLKYYIPGRRELVAKFLVFPQLIDLPQPRPFGLSGCNNLSTLFLRNAHLRTGGIHC